MPAPRLAVDGPTFTPSPYGLLSVAQFPPAGDPHWQNGIVYPSTCGGAALTWDECIAVTGAGGAPPPPPRWGQTAARQFRSATPFTVVTEFDCGLVGNAEAEQIARASFARVESVQVETAFWTGAAAGQTVVFPHLAANAAILDPQFPTGQVTMQTAAAAPTGSDTLLNLPEQLGLLEGAIASCYGGVGVIHVPQHAAATLDAWGLIHRNGPQYQTAAGNLVSVGAGYPGTSPAGAARGADRTWLYGTGAVFALRSDIRVRAADPGQNIDRATNTQRLIVERTYVVGFECCHYAVNPALGTPRGT